MPTRMKLTDINLIDVFSSPDCKVYFQEFREASYNKREIMFSPNETENKMFLIKSGRIRVYLAHEDKEFTLSILEAGDVFTTHTRAFCQALEDTTILIADIHVIKKIIEKVPDIALTMVHVLGDLMSNSITIINGLVFKDVQLRLIEFLIKTSEDKGQQVSDGIKVEVGLTTEEIAMILGSTRQTISMLLTDLRKSRIIDKIDRRTFLILDINKLQDLVKK